MAGDILMLTKRDAWSGYAVRIARAIFADRVEAHSGDRDNPLPDHLEDRRWRAIVSFLSPWIIPSRLFRRADLAINFHPGSAEYPGIGCYNFALYEEAREYGAVCHHLADRVDSGPIIAERLFPVSPHETVESLKLRTMTVMLDMFQTVIQRLDAIEQGEELGQGVRQWTRSPFTRRQLDELCRIEPGMTEAEIRRRIRATTFPGAPGPFVEIGGCRFETRG